MQFGARLLLSLAAWWVHAPLMRIYKIIRYDFFSFHFVFQFFFLSLFLSVSSVIVVVFGRLALPLLCYAAEADGVVVICAHFRYCRFIFHHRDNNSKLCIRTHEPTHPKINWTNVKIKRTHDTRERRRKKNRHIENGMVCRKKANVRVKKMEQMYMEKIALDYRRKKNAANR